MHARIETLVRELDGPVGDADGEVDGGAGGEDGDDEIPTPGFGQGVQVFELEHTSPETMVRLLGQLGLTGPQNAEPPRHRR